MRTAFCKAIDRFEPWCKLRGSIVRIESEVLIQPRRFRMAILAHLVELERKHKVLENELHEALLHVSTDDLQIVELKRRKLMVKDEIERLKSSANATLHYPATANVSALALPRQLVGLRRRPARVGCFVILENRLQVC